jgi:hypothetical protein
MSEYGDFEHFDQTPPSQKTPGTSEPSFEYLFPGIAKDSAIAQLGHMTQRQRDDAKALYEERGGSEPTRSYQTVLSKWLVYMSVYKTVELAVVMSDDGANPKILHPAITEAEKSQIRQIELSTQEASNDKKALQPDQAYLLRGFIEEVCLLYRIECGPDFNLHFRNFGELPDEMAA